MEKKQLTIVTEDCMYVFNLSDIKCILLGTESFNNGEVTKHKVKKLNFPELEIK